MEPESTLRTPAKPERAAMRAKSVWTLPSTNRHSAALVLLARHREGGTLLACHWIRSGHNASPTCPGPGGEVCRSSTSTVSSSSLLSSLPAGEARTSNRAPRGSRTRPQRRPWNHWRQSQKGHEWASLPPAASPARACGEMGDFSASLIPILVSTTVPAAGMPWLFPGMVPGMPGEVEGGRARREESRRGGGVAPELGACRIFGDADESHRP